MNKFNKTTILALMMLGGCSVTSHPDYQKTYLKENVTQNNIQSVNTALKENGLERASASIDSFGRLRLTGEYENEREVELAFTIARKIVGAQSVSSVRPNAIRVKDWEVQAAKEFAKYIDDLARKFQMSVEIRQGDEGKLIAVNDRGLDGVMQFQFGAAQPTSKAEEFYVQLARRIADDSIKFNQQRKILIVGHTDDVGNSRSNAVLSEKRAHSVGKIFESVGMQSDSIYYQGSGETMPIDDNKTEGGRARNRRVEIVDLSDEKSFREYLASRRTRPEFFRPVVADENVGLSVSKPSSTRRTEATRTVKPSNEEEKIEKLEFGGKDWGFDFGGKIASVPYSNVDIGKVAGKKSLNIISEARADALAVGNCVQDRPRISSEVKSLKSGKEYSTSEYFPGLYGSSWAANVNGHLVALTNVAVLRDGGVPIRKPHLLLYQNYSGDRNAQPNHRGEPEVNAYMGERGLLYRVFNSGPIRCMDIVIAAENPKEAPRSNLYYERKSALFATTFNPKLAK